MTVVTVSGNGASTARTHVGAALGGAERAAAAAVVSLVVLLGVIGAVNSFRAVAEAVEPSFGGLAWTVPVGVDVGIAVFTALDLLLARVGMRMAWLRLVPWVLVATTIYLNVAGEHDPIAAVAHGVLPALWVIAVEAGSHVVRSHVGLTRSPTVERMDRVRLSRWILAPASTLRLWRRMVLWETRSYSEALRRERDRQLACTDLQDRWGRWAWRWRAPRRARVLYRLGELAPAGTLAPATTGEGSAPAARPSTSGGRARVTSRRKPSPSQVDVGELVAVGRDVADELARDGAALTRASLAERLRARGLPVSNARLSALLAELRTAAIPRTEGTAR
jgi:Protein of unknown function (DUF2637)